MTRARQHHHLGPTTAIALAAVLTISACTPDQPAPARASAASSPSEEAPSPNSEPSPSASSTTVSSTTPRPKDAMRIKDGDGAAAALEYILALEGPMMRSGDTEEWDKRSHRSCEFCAARSDQARTIAERGDQFEGGDVKVRIDKVYERDPVTAIWPIDVTVTAPETRIIDANGDVVFSSGAETDERRAEVALRDGEWVLVGIGKIPGPA